jgi:hypothetical protein
MKTIKQILGLGESFADPEYGKQWQAAEDYLNGKKNYKDNEIATDAMRSMYSDFYKEGNGMRPRTDWKKFTAKDFKSGMESAHNQMLVKAGMHPKQIEKRRHLRTLLKKLKKGERITIASPKEKSKTGMHSALKKAGVVKEGIDSEVTKIRRQYVVALTAIQKSSNPEVKKLYNEASKIHSKLFAIETKNV